MTACRDLDLKARVVGSAEFVNQAKGFEETKDLEIHASRDAAKAGF
jgi:hypothetical protein